jgi:NADP-dependent aldehyde dehydrogenase
MFTLAGTSLIGSRRAGSGGKGTKALNPATGAALDPAYSWASAADVDAAAAAADDAFGAFSLLPGSKRAAFLRAIAQGLEAASGEIIERANLETALPPARLQGEMARTCGQLRLFAALVEEGSWADARIDHGDPGRMPLPKPDVRSLVRPLGPVAVFSSSNFPLAFSVAGGDTASALAAGCPVIVKPHQGHMGTSELVALVVRQAVQANELPEGTFSMVYGPGRDVGIALVRHPLVKAVGFTGSRAGGRALMDAAAARPEPIPVYAEMGSINPVFLLPKALDERAEAIAAGLHASVTLGVGQFCTNPGLVFAEAGPGTDAFLNKLATLMAATPPASMLTPSIWDEYCDGVSRFGRTPGVSSLLPKREDPKAEGLKVVPELFVVDIDTFLRQPALLDEVFGPSTLVVKTHGRELMLNAARAIDGQLTATIHASEGELGSFADLIDVLERKAGRLVFNGFPTGVEVCHAMNHGGPYPATADGRSTSVGTRALHRFARPVCYQSFPDGALPRELRESNPLGILRLVDGQVGRH